MRTKIITSLLVAYIFFSSSIAMSQQEDLDLKYIAGFEYTGTDYLGKYLKLSFLTKPFSVEKRPRLSPDLPSFPEQVALPYETFVGAFLVKDGAVIKKINTLEDLKGYVLIDSAEKAIEFVRFRTSMQTYFLFTPSILVEVFNADMVSGEDKLFGGCRSEFFQKNNLVNLKVVARSGMFEIHRSLVYYPWPGHQEYPSPPILYNVVERVSEDGNYSITMQEILRDFDYEEISYPLEPS